MFKFVSTKNSIELFHRAILSNDLQRTRLILEEAMKDPRFDIDEINNEGLTALQFSCFAGNLDIVKVLVSYKASIKKCDRDGNTLLHAAALAGKTEVVEYLLRRGLKPIVRNDNNQMPVDLTDEIAIIVILLRAMLDQGCLQEMQEYMLDHPKLKRNIFKELERVKCRENEKNEILRELPYSSHTSPRRHGNRTNRISSSELKGRSMSTFSKLSHSMQNLDQLSPEHTRRDYNNNHRHYHNNSSHENHVPHHQNLAPTLRRHNSTSSTSSHGSRSSRGSGGGILRNDVNDYETRHRQTQKYLETRFPSNSSVSKSVSFELDSPSASNYSDGYMSDTVDDKLSMRSNPVRPVSRSSSISSHSSNQTSVFSDSCINYDFPSPTMPTSPQDENIYQNVQSLNLRSASSLPTINEGENIYENLPLRNSSPKPDVPPPLPPRQPTIAQQKKYHNAYEYEDQTFQQYPVIEKLGSETDSGIDINETAGRVFALSLDDQNNTQTSSTDPDSYTKPIGIYYTDHVCTGNVQHHADNGPVLLRPSNGVQLHPKYRSWNGRTLSDQQHNQQQYVRNNDSAPYMSHRQRQQSRDDYDAYRTRQQQDHYQQHSQHGGSDRDLRKYSFEHQPEIML